MPFSAWSICQGTMLAWCSMWVSTTTSPSARLARPQDCTTRLSASVAFLVKTISADERAFDEALGLGPGGLEGVGGLLGDGVDAAVHVGVDRLVVVLHRVEHRRWASARWRPSRGRRSACRAPCGRAAGSRPSPAPRRVGRSWSAPCVVALGLESGGQLGAAGLDDAPVDEDVHEVGLQLVEQPLVVGDGEDAEVGAGGAGPRARPWRRRAGRRCRGRSRSRRGWRSRARGWPSAGSRCASSRRRRSPR